MIIIMQIKNVEGSNLIVNPDVYNKKLIIIR